MRQFVSPDWQPPSPSTARMTRATSPALVRLLLAWEADRHDQPTLALPEDRPVEWRTLTADQTSRLNCRDLRCILVRDLLRRAHAAGRAAQLAEVARALDAMMGPQ